DVELEFVGNAAPEHRKLAGLGQQHLVAGRQRVDEGCFPGACAGRGKDDHRVLGAKNPLQSGHDGVAEFGEFWTAMVKARHVHRPQYPIRYIGRAWNLKKMPSCMQGHLSSFPGQISEAIALTSICRGALSPSRPIPSTHK